MIFLSLLLMFLTGILFVTIFLKDEGIFKNLSFKFCLAFGLGAGITSLTYFFHTLFWGSNLKTTIFFEVVLMLILLIILFISKPNLINSEKQEKIITKSAFNYLLPISFFITAFSSLLYFVMFSLKNPHGTWDAWFIWNAHARFIYRMNENISLFFKNAPDWTHPDYPPMISSMVSRGWQFIGQEQLLFPMVVALLFTFGLVFLLYSSLSVIRTKNQGYLAGLVMLSTFVFVQQGASQYADVPIGFYFLLTLVLLSFKDKFNNNSFLILAGITAGLSAWCKNEGMLFIIAVSVARFIAVLSEKGFKKAFNEMLFFLYGLFPLLAGILYFKIGLAPENDIFYARKTGDYISRILSVDRYKEIVSQFFIAVKYYFGRLSGIPLLFIYAVMAGIKINREDKTTLVTIFTTLAIMTAGYFVIYLITPHDLYWHLNTSLYRLMLQLWPSLLFAYFLIVKTPEENLQ